MRFEDRVLIHEFQLTETEDQIVDYIRKNQEMVSKMSIQSLSKKLQVVPTTIMRLSKKLGYSGYSELKLSLLKDVNEGKSYRFLPSSLLKTMEMIDNDLIERIAELIKKCDTCYWFGVGESQFFCEMMVTNLKSQNKNSASSGQYHEIERTVRASTKNDLILFISASGNNQRLIQYAKQAKEKGVPIISITHCLKNPLAECCDYNLYFWGERRIVNGYNVTDRLGLNFILRQLSETFWRIYWI